MLPPILRSWMRFGASSANEKRIFNSCNSTGYAFPYLSPVVRYTIHGTKRLSSSMEAKAITPNHYPNSELIATTVPIIVVFTKLDLLVARAKMTRSSLGQVSQESVEQSFRENQVPEFEQLSKSEERKISYTVVGCTFAFDVDSFSLTCPYSHSSWYGATAHRLHNTNYRIVWSSSKCWVLTASGSESCRM